MSIVPKSTDEVERFPHTGYIVQLSTGPDGKQYAVGGEVPIDLSPVSGNPQATVQKAETIQRAALAPADPSGPDLRSCRPGSFFNN
jgi:hypothetical protein